MFGGEKGINRIADPGRIFNRGQRRGLDRLKRVPAPAGQVLAKGFEQLRSRGEFGGGRSVLGIAGEMAGEQLLEVGHAVAVAVLVGRDFEANRDVRRFAGLALLRAQRPGGPQKDCAASRSRLLLSLANGRSGNH